MKTLEYVGYLCPHCGCNIYMYPDTGAVGMNCPICSSIMDRTGTKQLPQTQE